MKAVEPRHSKEEFAERGDAIYEREISAQMKEGHLGEYVAIDIETGEHEIAIDELTASDRLLSRVPDAQIWLRRIGFHCVRRFGPRPRSPAP